MTESEDPTAEQEREHVVTNRPHLVILGAGASRAAFPDGDRNGKKLPLMADFVDTLNLRPVLASWGTNPDDNFESIFSDIYEAGEEAQIEFLQTRIREYFGGLQIGARPTLYDHLLLSLRKKDHIATFNWDPLLLQAYTRNQRFELPCLHFLHGNVEVGYCFNDQTAGLLRNRCNKCSRPFTPTPLLYPIRKKDYAANEFIASEWKIFKQLLSHTFMVTVFGYSGPRTDEEALNAMSVAWGAPEERELEQTCFITLQDQDALLENFANFIHSHHYEVDRSFYDSWIARHPRRTGEAWLNQYLLSKFIPDNPVPKEADFPELYSFFEQFTESERRFDVERAASPKSW